MHHPHLIYRFQWLVIVGGLVLTLGYGLLFRSLVRENARLDQALLAQWNKIVAINLKYNTKLGIDLATVQDNEIVANKAVAAMQRATRQVRQRIELDPETREQLRQPIQLLDFDQKRFQMIFDLQRLAEEKKVKLESGVVGSFPEYVPGRDRPALAWAQLVLFDTMLATAVANGPTAIKAVNLLTIKTHPSLVGGRNPLYEFPVRLELVGSMEAVVNFLRSLPLQNEELQKLQLPIPPRDKPALFISKIILKSVAGNPNEVHLDLVISGFVSLELFS